MGGGDLERPPNGPPTEAALVRCRALLPEALAGVVARCRVLTVMFGQGLIEQVAEFQPLVEKISPGTMTHRAMSTATSEDAGGMPGGEGCAQQ